MGRGRELWQGPGHGMGSSRHGALARLPLPRDVPEAAVADAAEGGREGEALERQPGEPNHDVQQGLDSALGDHQPPELQEGVPPADERPGVHPRPVPQAQVTPGDRGMAEIPEAIVIVNDLRLQRGGRFELPTLEL